ncbi:hypothetical protein [Magnetococcus sp. PR-3]|uniref:hypothetical protein n=1 Tax=Magnetococcus sp. PR-3 TaxID=3120355 RepID=UPI002FCE4D93
MWIFLEGGRFLSVEAHASDPALFQLRARLPGDIEVDFPDAQVYEAAAEEEGPGHYRFHALVARDQVLKAIAHELEDLSYPQFQKTICNANRVLAASRCDDAMRQAQEAAREGQDQDSICYPPSLQPKA